MQPCGIPPALQYAPWLGIRILKRVGPARARALREGRSGYDMNSLLKDSGDQGDRPAS